MRRIFLPMAAMLLAGAGASSVAAPPPQTVLERAVLAELNFARANPRTYAARLRTYRGYFRGRIVRYPGNPAGLRTEEGVAAVDEAIAFLQRQRPLPPLSHSRLLALAAADHVREQGPRGATGHDSPNGDRARQRVARHGGGSFVAENITYGPPTAVEVVRQLIVDDGVKGRGHRRVVYSSEFAWAGTSCGPHRVYRRMCVMVHGATERGFVPCR